MGDHLQDLQPILSRLDKLERHNRYLRLTCGVTALVAICVLLMAQAAFKDRTIEAHRFILEDADGRVRAELRMSTVPKLGVPSATAEPALVLYDAASREAASLSVTGDSAASLDLGGNKVGVSLSLSAGPGGSGMYVFGPRNLERFGIDADSTDTCISMWDSKTKHYAIANIRVCDTQKEHSITILGENPSLTLSDKERVLWKAP